MEAKSMIKGLTNTEKEIYDFLSDGKYHRKESLHKAINEFAKWESISNYLRLLKHKLARHGLSIEVVKHYEAGKPVHRYRLVRKIARYID